MKTNVSTSGEVMLQLLQAMPENVCSAPQQLPKAKQIFVQRCQTCGRNNESPAKKMYEEASERGQECPYFTEQVNHKHQVMKQEEQEKKRSPHAKHCFRPFMSFMAFFGPSSTTLRPGFRSPQENTSCNSICDKRVIRIEVRNSEWGVWGGWGGIHLAACKSTPTGGSRVARDPHTWKRALLATANFQPLALQLRIHVDSTNGF
ncbi:unnamed protein product [Rangifer tarandus platyrhynchus]|uniref:Uncharacterized protein n=1 Tax=Rangifer tarandus platyrhynchus TaxID=3082113 RepID=A0ABN9A7K7_RANTA|nr:unnamed protein product [Rangifer tarandus platyrhynchus]